MITVNLHISEGLVSRYAKIRAGSLKRAIQIAGSGRPGVKVEIAGPLRLVYGPALAEVSPGAASPAA